MQEKLNKQPGTAFDIGSAERVMEGNWEWMRAEGFHAHETLPVDKIEYEQMQRYKARFGRNNVRQGDVYDPESDRPLRHAPGMTIYVRDEPSADQQGQSSEPRPRA
jgi:hypothetical protein